MRKDCCVTILLLLLSCVANSQKKISNHFVLEGKISNYTGYIYLNYQNKKDSCLVVDSGFVFKGFIYGESTIADFSCKGLPAIMSKDFYIENKQMQVELLAEIKQIKEYRLTNFILTSVKGTKTSMIQDDFEVFVAKHQSDMDYYEKLYVKVNTIVSQNPKNVYSGNLLSMLSGDDKLNKNELAKIYLKLSKKYQDENSIKRIEYNLFPERRIEIESPVLTFQLPNRYGVSFNNDQLKGKFYLIDFWASWCSPCRKQLPELKRIYDLFKDKNFEIIGISIDKSEKKWTKALDEENLSWINLIENKEFLGEVVKKFNVFFVPSNFLINPEGKIVAKDITLDDLKTFLNQNIK